MLGAFALFLLLSACSSPMSSRLNTSSPTPSPTPRQTEKVPPTRTDCPTNGKARPFVNAYLARGDNDTLVYFDNTTGKTLLKLYNADTRKATTALALSKVQITNMQVSGDGQWVLFVAWTRSALYPRSDYIQPYTGTTMLQAVRIDGQGLQTLYCTQRGQYMEAVTWSPDGRQIAFQQTTYLEKSSISTYVLGTGDGSLYIPTTHLLQNKAGSYYKPLTWLDNTHLAMVHFFDHTVGVPLPPAEGIYSLDTRLKHVYTSSEPLPQFVPEDTTPCWSEALSPDMRTLYYSTCYQDKNGFKSDAKTTISAYPTTGAKSRAVFSKSGPPLFAITSLIAATRSALYFQVWDGKGTAGVVDNSQIWRVNLDGSGLKRVFAMNRMPYGIDRTMPWGALSRSERWLVNISAKNGDYSSGDATFTVNILSLEKNSVSASIASFRYSMIYFAGPIAVAGWTQL